MGEALIRSERTGDGTLVLTLDDPPANTYSYEMMRQLDAAILEARMDTDVHALVLRGSTEEAAERLRAYPRAVAKDPRFVTLGEAQRLVPFWAAHRPDVRFLVLGRSLASAAASFVARPEAFERGDAVALETDLGRFLGAFHEAVTNRICDDLVAAVKPRSITVTGKFWVRGGISTTVTVTHAKA